MLLNYHKEGIKMMKIQPNQIYVMPKYNSQKKEIGSNILTEKDGVITNLETNELGINVFKAIFYKTNKIDIKA